MSDYDRRFLMVIVGGLAVIVLLACAIAAVGGDTSDPNCEQYLMYMQKVGSVMVPIYGCR